MSTNTNTMNTSIIDLFAQRETLVKKDVTPWQTFSGRGMHFQLESYDWGHCACLSHLSMRAALGLMKMETVICTPYSKDLPLFSYDGISAFGKQTVFLEFYDTLLEPIDLSPLMAVKESYSDLKDKTLKPAWYDSLRLPPCTFKVGRGTRMTALPSSMASAYLDLFPSSRNADIPSKVARNSNYVESLISNGGPAINTIRAMLGNEAAETMFRRFLFGTEI